ncbi:hypothetical protein [Bacillus sp. NPDC094106]|uniref:hypothetical protein n=1 Tax=Bacillus sp. NPDC094106 TaxID=3363949 RepID=UPI00380DFCD5
MAKYECGYCDKVYDEVEWNEATQKESKGKIVPIKTAIEQQKAEEHGYSCPECGEYQDLIFMRQIQ